MSVVSTQLAENSRTQTQAAIKRASKAARADMRKMVSSLEKALETAYRQAVQDLRENLDAAAVSGESLRLDVMRDLLSQAEERLAKLESQRNALLDQGLLDAADKGVQPFARDYARMRTSLTQLADDAVRFVTTFVAEDGLQLSDRIWAVDAGARESVTRAIQSSIIQGHSASQAAQEFLSRGEAVPKSIAQKASGATPGQIHNTIRKELVTGDASAYSKALRVFRTEINRAHGEAYQAASFEHPDVIGTRFLLSPRHPRVDICDMHAKVNRYGLGPGVYPKGKNPWPAHPNTLSFVEVVFDDEVTDEDKKGKEDRISWLKQQPQATQIGVLGVKKAWALRAGYLPESAINTPWVSIKSRLQKKGIDVPAITGAVPVINLPDSPHLALPANKPVSAAFVLQGQKRVANTVLKVIDSTHSDGALPVIPIKRSTSRHHGGYSRTVVADEAIDIEVSSKSDHKEFTLAHEIGHFLDHKGIPGERMSSEYHDLMENWRKAVMGSPEVQAIEQLYKKGGAVTLPDGREVTLPLEHLEYLLRKREMWARSYSQWLARKSGHPILNTQLEVIIDRENGYPFSLHTQWTDASFTPIAEAIEDLFKTLGWIDG